MVQVMFVLHNAEEVSQTSKHNGNGSPKARTSGYDLTLALSETENGLKGCIEYSTDIFEAQTIPAPVRTLRNTFEGDRRRPGPEHC